MRAWLCVVVTLAALLPGAAGRAQPEREPLVLAITAYDEPAIMMAQLAPLIAALERELPGIDLELAISNQDGVEAMVRGNRADAVLTNPYHYLRLLESDSLSGALATVERGATGGPVSSLGGTVVTLARRDDLASLADLRDRRIAIADRRATGGYVLPLAALESAGVSRDNVRWIESGSERQALDAVLAGEADAAFLRSSLLEAFIERGVVQIGVLQVLNRQQLGDYPYAVSTRLYPEWPLVIVAGADRDQVTRILGVALQRPDAPRITTPSAIAGLRLPADYGALRSLLRELRLPPYDAEPAVSFLDLWRSHRLGVSIILGAGVLVLGMSVVLWRGNRQLRELSRALNMSLRVREAQQGELERAANYDALTGLPNRTLFLDRLEQAMATCERRQTEIGLVYLDLDNFKPVNDSLGHAAGDELLIQLSDRLRSELRKSDTVARIGGDEFVILLAELASRREGMQLVERILHRVTEPLQLSGGQVEISASAGLAFFGAGQHNDADHLLRQADQAMYRAKEGGRNCYRVLDVQADSELSAFLTSVERGLDHGEFCLYYQPLVDMHSAELIGVEALVRWRQGEQLLMPDSFLPQLAGRPLGAELEAWVLREAVAQLSRWRDQGRALSMHVNITPLDLSQTAFVGRLRDLLAEFEITEGLCLEILESAAMADAERVNRVMEECADLGVTFALDDFGTGYSSLSHIKDLRTNGVKIDRRFVQAVFHSYDDFSILAAIVAMARAFDRYVVAEGVETPEQGAMLLRLGCRIAQGYGIARPMPAEALLPWYAAWKPDVSWPSVDADLVAQQTLDWSHRQQAWQEMITRLVSTGPSESSASR